MAKLHLLKNVSSRCFFPPRNSNIDCSLGLEMPLATQKTDTGLTMGQLKILHRQVSISFPVKYLMFFENSIRIDF